MKLHIVSDYMAELKYCNELLKLFDKSGDFRLLDIVNRFCYLWED